jgi:hypothetical protein
MGRLKVYSFICDSENKNYTDLDEEQLEILNIHNENEALKFTISERANIPVELITLALNECNFTDENNKKVWLCNKVLKDRLAKVPNPELRLRPENCKTNYFTKLSERHYRFAKHIEPIESLQNLQENYEDEISLLKLALTKKKENNELNNFILRFRAEHGQKVRQVLFKIAQIYPNLQLLNDLQCFETFGRIVTADIEENFDTEKLNADEGEYESNLEAKRPWESIQWTKEMLIKAINEYNNTHVVGDEKFKIAFVNIKTDDRFENLTLPDLRFQLIHIDKKFSLEDINDMNINLKDYWDEQIDLIRYRTKMKNFKEFTKVDWINKI